MERVNEARGDEGKERKPNCTDCTICLYDVLWRVSWARLLARESVVWGSEQLSGCEEEESVPDR